MSTGGPEMGAINRSVVSAVHELTDLSFVPSNLGPRKALYQEVLGLLKGNKEEITLFLSGNPASGKTTVIERIRMSKGIHALYVNAALFGAPEQIFIAIYRQLCGTETRISPQRAYELLEAYRTRRRVILIVDEVDYLTKRTGAHQYDQVYRLLELQEFSMVFVANSLNFASELSRVHSRLGAMQNVVFGDYTAEQMVEMARLRLGQYSELVDARALELLALRCATHADLRRFLVCVYRAFQVAARRGARRVEVADAHHVTQARRGLGFLTSFQLQLLDAVTADVTQDELCARACGRGLDGNDVLRQLACLCQQNVLLLGRDGRISANVGARTVRAELEARGAAHAR